MVGKNGKLNETIEVSVLWSSMCGFKLEGHGCFLCMEGGKQCPPLWVYFKRIYTCMGVFFREFTTLWVYFERVYTYHKSLTCLRDKNS